MINKTGTSVHVQASSSSDLQHGGPSTNCRPEIYSWPRRFYSRQLISESWENTPWVQTILRHISQTADIFEDEADILNFLRTEENWSPDQSRVDAFLGLFRGATLQKLQCGDQSVPKDKVALLIDGNCSENRPRLRPFLGGLTAKNLLEELTKKRYDEDSSLVDNEEKSIDAERRLIYITDLNSWTILALIGSAPESLIRPLGDFLTKYLTSTSSIGVSFATKGPETFTLEFSLPFRAWRTTEHLKHDPRIMNNNQEPLRSSRDVTFLRAFAGTPGDTSPFDLVYASKISCMITGYDQHRWTAVKLVETWFEEDGLVDPTPDEITRYENDFEDGLLVDPLLRGTDTPDISTWEPRRYFIEVLQLRLRQVYLEWNALEQHLSTKVQAASKRHKSTIRCFKRSSLETQSTQNQYLLLQELDETEGNLTDTVELLTELRKELKEALRSGERFMATDVNYFLDLYHEDSIDCIPHLSQIRQTFQELDQVNKRLGDLHQYLQSMLADVATARQKVGKFVMCTCMETADLCLTCIIVFIATWIDLESNSNNVEYIIPICLPINGSRLPELNEMSSRTCHDDKTFFGELKELLREKSWLSWPGLLYRTKLIIPIGMHYVKFEIRPDRYVCIIQKPEYPPQSEFAKYRPTKDSFDPISSSLLLSYYEQAPDFRDDDHIILDRIIHKIDGRFPLERPTGVGYGLEIEEGPNHYRLWILRLSSVILAVSVGVGWAASGRDIQSGFAITSAVSLLLLVCVEGLSLLASGGSVLNRDMDYLTL
ncbi:hypothetical protein LZ32DRAFT_665116 [Colletotrichum eremochloae]|nr:hypothetical protein LZ32DRAFT_665116 [Colletotrichum eremochloae]